MISSNLELYITDWPKMARDIFRVKLDNEQEKIVHSVQNNRRTTVKSGHARGKDFTAALVANCFLYSYYPSKVICTAPTGRQVTGIMMSEISKIRKSAAVPLGGILLENRIKFKEDKDWYLEGFKAADKATESWTGFHSPHMLVIVTEASGIDDMTFTAIDGILTGTISRLLIVGNPNRTTGEFYQSFRSKIYQGKFTLDCLDAINVKSKKIVIPGQVDYEWVAEKVEKWCREIDESVANPNIGDFVFDRKWYRPNDLFLVKVRGWFPSEAPDQLIPLQWVEMAIERWNERKSQAEPDIPLRLGVDIAGMGRDSSVYCHRRGNIVIRFEEYSNPEKSELIHMENAGRIKNLLIDKKDHAFIDTIGEGAGVHSRLIEQDVNSVSVKFSESAKELSDYTQERTFANMRAYCWWAVRDALDPKNKYDLALPPEELLIEDLTTPKWEVRSNGEIMIEKKEKIVERLGRSPDYGDALANTFYPETVPAAEVASQTDRSVYRHERRLGVF